MKTLQIIVFLILITSSYSGYADYTIQDGDIGLSSIQGELLRVKRLCPKGKICKMNGTKITLTFTLAGCLDNLGPVLYKAERDLLGNLDLYVSALNVSTYESTKVKCFKMPEEEFSITRLNEFYKANQIRLNFLQ